MFPTIVYKTPGTHQRAGGTYSYLGVQSAEELGDALSSGWFQTLPEAIAGKAVVIESDDSVAPTRGELEQKAEELHIKFDGRTTDKSLAEKIEAALEAQE